MNDAEIRAKVEVGDGGGFLRLGNSIKAVDKQASYLRTRIDEIKSTLARADIGFEVGDTMKLEAELERVQNKYNSLYATSEKTTNSISKGWDKGGKSLNRFLFNLFSIGSVFALVAKASRSYLDTNEQAQAQTEITANTMGQLLAPAMRVILNMTQYLVIGFALLIKMFTGYNALAKVTTKNISAAAKETKKLTKELTTMDEVTNLSQDNEGISSGLAADLSALDSFNKKILEVQKLFKEWNIQIFVDKLKELATWIWDNKEAVVALGLTLAATFGVSKLLGGISALIGVGGTGLTGLLGVLLAIAAISVIVIKVSALVTGIEQMKEALKVAQDVQKATADSGKALAYKMKESGTPKQISTYIASLQNYLKTFVDEQKALEKRGATKKNIQVYKDAAASTREELRILGAVPKYANGGVVTKATLGISGEYSGATSNPEIISPQSLMRETMIEAFNQIIPMINQEKGDITLNVNGRELAKATYDDYQYEGQRTGKQTIVRRVG